MTVESKTVLIAGAFGYGNTGDDAILKVIVRDLRNEVPGIELVVISNDPDETQRLLGGASIHRTDIVGIVDAVKKCDLMILGGGGLFYDYWGVEQDDLLTKQQAEIPYYTGFCLLATLLAKPLIIYAVGVGPLMSESGKLFTRAAFEQAHTSTVRDPESKKILVSLGLDETRLHVTADPAFSFQGSDQRRRCDILEKEIGVEFARPLLGVALRNWDVGVDPDRWERETAISLDNFIGQYNATILFIPFQTMTGTIADDRSVIDRVRNYIKHKSSTRVLGERYCPEDKAAIIEGCDLFLGMRMHGIIFALKAGVPAVALIYDPKVGNALARIGCQEYGVELGRLEAQALTELLSKAYDNRSRLRERLKNRSGDLVRLCREPARLVGQLLANEAQPVTTLSVPMTEVVKRLVVRQMLRNSELERSLEAQLMERQQSVGWLSTRIEELEKIVRARDEAIDWLNTELALARNGADK